MASLPLFLLLFAALFFSCCRCQMPGFVSVDCGGTESFTDELGLEWAPDNQFPHGEATDMSVPNESRKQYARVRYFPADKNKYCYTFNVTTRNRYLVRTSFLYGNLDGSDAYPVFDISIGASYWSTVLISNNESGTIINKEAVYLASSDTVSVCLYNAKTGRPFISTIELRQFNDSLYRTEYETQFFMSLSARINSGAQSNEPVRYPDDPFDRIWESDWSREDYLVDVAEGTEKISTNKTIDVNIDDEAPQKVMQTAVVGRNGSLSYRLYLNDFPANGLGNGWASAYFAEIEDIGAKDTRKFRIVLPGHMDLDGLILNVQENAHGKYRLYEPGTQNISLPFIFSFGFQKTDDSSLGPILNAFEVYKYRNIHYGSLDASSISSFASHFLKEVWAQEGGDPCLPVPWSWVLCNTDPQPRIASILLSGKNLTGRIPSELANLTGLVELWLDGNMLTGPIPDFSGCLNLKIIHLENNQLTGPIPSYFADLPNLSVLYLQNNMLSGIIPNGLLTKNIDFNYSGNTNLEKKRKNTHLVFIICCVMGFCMLLMVLLAWFLFARKRRRYHSKKDNLSSTSPSQKQSSSFSDLMTETGQKYTLLEIESATSHFAQKVGIGGYGTVYYGKLKDEKEIAVKVVTNDSYQGTRQFSNEVSLLSRIHHRNLVTFLGQCQQDGKNILVYEFMHNGTLKEHLHGPSSEERELSWIKRLEIAEDAAKGIEYLHTGCSPAIIHRDIKTSNILLDAHMRAKVSDFGLSRPTMDETHVSTVVGGTMGYLDPEYYTFQQLTTKSDVYSFGIVLFELISGKVPISNTSFGRYFRHIARWAKFYYQNGEVEAIIDPRLRDGFNSIQSVWKITEVAVRCTNHEMINRPTMSEVLKEIQEAIAIERGLKKEINADDQVNVAACADSLNEIALDFSTDSSSQAELRKPPEEAPRVPYFKIGGESELTHTFNICI